MSPSSWLFHCCFWGWWRFTPQSSAASSTESSFNADLCNWFPWSWKEQTPVFGIWKTAVGWASALCHWPRVSLLGLGTMTKCDTKGCSCRRAGTKSAEEQNPSCP